MFKIQEIGRSPTPKKPITVYAVREDKIKFDMEYECKY